MAYDAFGNYIGDFDTGLAPVDPEEERRLREEELRKQQEAAASAVAQEEKVTTYADGTRTITTKKEVPAEPIKPLAVDQSVYTAQMESGGKPDIGYHFPADEQGRRQSTAFGAYGITAPAYQDVQKANPQFAGRDITTLNPEEQKAAYETYTGLNAQRLQGLGINPTPEAQRLAHLLGAGGAAKFLTTGEVSPAAAAANGGIENLKRIASQRLAGGPGAVASGAAMAPTPQAITPQPVAPTGEQQLAPVSPAQAAAFQEANADIQGQPSPYSLATGQGEPGLRAGEPVMAPAEKAITDYQATQNDPMALMKLSTDENAPEFIKERARNRAADIITQQREIKSAQEKVQGADETQLAKWLKEKTTGGSWVKAILFAAMGAKQLAQEEGAKLGIGTESVVMGPDGKPAIIKMSANGTPLEGFDGTTGQKLTAEQLVTFAAGAGSKTEVSTSAEQFQDKEGNIYRSQSDKKGNLVMRNAVTGEVYRGSEKLTRVRDVAGQAADERKQGFKRENDATMFANRIKGMDYDSKLKAVAEFRQSAINRGEPDLTDSELSAMGVTRPDIGGVKAQPTATPTSVPPTPLPTGTTPTAAQAQGAVPPTAIPGTSVTGRMTPSQAEKLKAEEKVTREVGEAEQKKFIESKRDIGESSSGGQSIGSARRQQLDLIKQNPSILNIMNGSGTQFDQARNIITRIATGAYSDENKEALYADVKNTGLGQAEQAALRDFANLNTGINAKTLKANSGAGAISNAEQQANKDANIGNVDRIPAFAALSGLHRSQFSGDLAASKQAFLDKNPELKTDAQFNSAWQKEEAKHLNTYRAIAKARFDVMGKPPEANASKEAMNAYKDRVFRAFEAYPAPQWDAASGKWNYQTANAQRAAALSILGR